MNYDQLKLDNQLCFALYACSKEVTRLYKPVLDPLGLTYTQYLVMMALWENDNLSVSELGQQLFLASNTLTPLLKKMEAQNLITRTRSTVDERSVHVRLTQAGSDLKVIAADVPGKVFCTSGLTPQTAAALRTQLKDLLAALVDV